MPQYHFTGNYLIFLPVGSEPVAKTVTDQLGRVITLPDDPQRLVSLAPSITEVIFALGQEHRLKGVTRFSDFPPEALKLPRVGSYVCLDLERIVALNPDLCFAIKEGFSSEEIDGFRRILQSVVDRFGEQAKANLRLLNISTLILIMGSDFLNVPTLLKDSYGTR